jgi:hypothetical protein
MEMVCDALFLQVLRSSGEGVFDVFGVAMTCGIAWVACRMAAFLALSKATGIAPETGEAKLHLLLLESSRVPSPGGA